MITKILEKVIEGQDLSEVEMFEAMTQIMEGKIGDTVLASFLTALRIKGESVQEITGAVRVMRKKGEKIKSPSCTILDTCGTGGDASDTFNISTTAAFVAAGNGISVAKHGNKSVSSRSGSADVLTCLGVNIQVEKPIIEHCLNEIGIGFLFAPLFHPAMKHAAPVRKALGIRTIFNLLGPLTNPAGAQTQIIGVFDSRWTYPLAQVLCELGLTRAYVVHGIDGLDEITLSNSTQVSELKNGVVKSYRIEPEQFGFKRCSLEELKGGSPNENASIIRGVLEGKLGPKRDIVLLNAGAGIAVGRGITLKEGVQAARESIDSGAALQKLNDLIRLTERN